MSFSRNFVFKYVFKEAVYNQQSENFWNILRKRFLGEMIFKVTSVFWIIYDETFCENIFTKSSIIVVWQGTEYALIFIGTNYPGVNKPHIADSKLNIFLSILINFTNSANGYFRRLMQIFSESCYIWNYLVISPREIIPKSMRAK